ncbi:MAG TPA: PstS family phosphate ABC transporter substrate-binding protein [Pseudonocardiaceae bacterium]|nr:PstS family phosphate ABC transporter substrate-binding protein [Pseudonocardiaceae bacterium]
MTRSTLRRRGGPAAVACAAAMVLAACGGQSNDAAGGGGGGGDLSGKVLVDGSSTVGPLSSAAAELYAEGVPGVNVTVATSGTGGGFKKFCGGETDISDASRPISDEEKQACTAKGIEYVELQVANDALTVVANPQNNWANCLTTAQLKTMWGPEAEGKVKTWNQVDPAFPPEPLALFGPGTDSGTFDYFTDEINGEEGASREDYSPSEDDNVIVQGVSGSAGGLGYFGYTYFEENADKLKAVQIDGGNGCVAPSAQTVQNGTYKPLSRPLFIYVSKAAYASKPQVKGFVDFYVGNDAKIAEAAQYVPLNDEQKAALKTAAGQLGGG